MAACASVLRGSSLRTARDRMALRAIRRPWMPDDRSTTRTPLRGATSLFADRPKPVFADGAHDSIRPMTADYLATLNLEQRRAVEHGGENSPPLLIIAGAGSGKTNTLAHRVAHLIVRGADPRRMMLLTFSRRAAAEMSRRVQHIARQVLSDQGPLTVDAL